MLMLEYKDVGWWYWLASAILVSAGLSGLEQAFLFAVFLNIINTAHYFLREKSMTSFPVQVRIGFLLILTIAYPQPLRFIYWIPGIGLWAQIVFGYCGMARFMSIMPWNKEEQYSMALMSKTFLSKPVRGSVMQGFAKE